MRWNKPNRHLRGVVVVPSCKDNIFNISMGFGTLKQKVWTLMARWILGLTRFSACLLWRLGLTHAKLEESTSCTPSCYGPTWHLQCWLVGCNGLTTYGNFRARGLSDTTWMHWYRAVQAAIGEELHHYTCDKIMLVSECWGLIARLGDAMRCLQPPAVFCIFEADAGQERSLTSPRFQASRSRNWLEQIVHAAALETPQSQIGIVLKNKAYNLTHYTFKDSNLFP